jgi:flagellar L-ring protein precursor FlgH
MTLSRTRLLTIAALGSLMATSLVHAQAAAQAATQPPKPTNGAAPAAAATAAPATPAVPVRSSWVSDRRDFAVGDIITVLIDDYTISTAVKEDLATDTRSRGLSMNAQLPSSNKSVGIDSRNTADQTKRGQAKRENRFQNEMSVRVVAVAPNGLLQVKGTKKIDVDKAQQDIVFTGFIRPQDITTGNSVESSRVADISIGYVSPGPLGTPKQGMLTKILGALWP